MRPHAQFGFLLALLLAASSAATVAAPAEETDALATRAAKAEPEAIVQLLDMARSGDAEAQLRVGLIYYDGRVVERNFALALEWLHKAAAKGQNQAMNLIGHFCQEGLGVPQDYVQA